MANAPLKKIIGFYCRFTPSYSKIGFNFRKLFWRPLKGNFAGQVWLVTGGSEGIGGSAAHSAVAGGATDLAALEQQATAQLNERGWQTDYLTVRRRSDLQAPQGSEQGSDLAGAATVGQLVALGAARLGRTRLIDNWEF